MELERSKIKMLTKIKLKKVQHLNIDNKNDFKKKSFNHSFAFKSIVIH